MTWHEGATLQQMLDADHHFTVAEVVQHGVRLLKGIAALHRLEIAHRDIKPATSISARMAPAHPRSRCRRQSRRKRCK